MREYHSRGSNYVPALREHSTRVEIIEAAPAQLPAPPQTVLLPHAGYEDRAKGFSLATSPLAGVVGFVAALAGVDLECAIASLATLLLALGGFASVWLIAYIAHTLISPGGATFAHVVLMWAYLRREQRERHRRYARLRAKDGGDYE